ncbi:MAG: hypothetical protein KDA88_18235 [Planctomycetaceae bacterium]|nr:hypothetical protein [Planctomycetaceae bacterium]MCB9952242.1 hypothetical protein [Planctomycetaceae bacterium]
MSCRLMSAVVVLFGLASPAFGFEVTATIRKIDPEKRVANVFANGQERTVKIAMDAKFLDEAGENLKDGLSAPEFKAGTTVTLTVERNGNVPEIVSIRLGGRTNPSRPMRASVGKPSVGFKPLTEMTLQDRYKGEDGGLYGQGNNEPPAELAATAKCVAATIQPLDANGKPAENGKIGLVSISMSNATQEFSRFKQLADADPEKSSRVAVVDCAQGGQTMARWADARAACWSEAERRLSAAGVAREQIQVAWVKLANAGPSGELQVHGKQLEQDTRTVLANLVKFFPNLKVAYLGSRIYGGYADGQLNPEPYAYEGAFVVRWLIQNQSKGDMDLNFNPQQGPVHAPLLLWGPYFWGDGTTPRKSDGLIWERSDFVNDGTHPSDSGRQKVAAQLLDFFKQDAHARTWFVEK